MAENPSLRGLALWLPFLGVILAAVITGVFALLASGGGTSNAGAPSTTAGTTPASTVTAGPAAAPPASSPATTPSGAAEIPTEQFNRKITLQAGATDDAMDLDTVPPQLSEEDADNDVLLETDMRESVGDVADFDGGARIAKWKGDGVPDYAQCQDAAATQGIRIVENVKKGTVLCVRTSEGRTARLTVSSFEEFHSMTFDTVVWSR
ncbi:hypothetical protein ACIA8K_37965 [Catenuloplanes sp. NPDC051500]|uniref:hypothetical protein n=1 Tax=Catenuloplanes sp. NPDC051500 TaxID=3363959 RepID=UPI00378FC6B1